MAADLVLTLVNCDGIAACCGHTRMFKARGAGANHEHPLGGGLFAHRTCAPHRFAPHHRVVRALNATAANHRAPTLIGGDAAADVVHATLFDLGHPLLVGDHLPARRMASASPEPTSSSAAAGWLTRPTRNMGLFRHGLNGAGVLAFPSLFERHRHINANIRR